MCAHLIYERRFIIRRRGSVCSFRPQHVYYYVINSYKQFAYFIRQLFRNNFHASFKISAEMWTHRLRAYTQVHVVPFRKIIFRKPFLSDESESCSLKCIRRTFARKISLWEYLRGIFWIKMIVAVLKVFMGHLRPTVRSRTNHLCPKILLIWDLILRWNTPECTYNFISIFFLASK